MNCFVGELIMMKNIARATRGRLLRSLFVPLFASAAALPAFAWDGTPSGKVSTIEVTAGSNYGFRVWLDAGQQALCNGGTAFAFLNETDSNYKVYVASLLMAKAQGSAVTVYLTNVNGFCHIGHLAVHP